MNSSGSYVEKYHRWIIGTLITALVPLLIYFLQKNDAIIPETKSFYYANLQSVPDSANMKNAECWITSLSSNRSDAFRCAIDNGINDPCFQNAIGDGSFIVCPGEPYEKNPESFKMVSRPKYDPEVEKGTSIPWYIILNNDQKCRFLTGATTTIANRRVDYGCDDGAYNSLLLPMKEVGKMLEIGCSTEDRIESCPIKEAWY